MPSAESPVFYDPVGRRWKRVRRIWMALAIAVTSLAAILVASVLINPVLPSLSIRPVSSLPHTTDLKPKPLTVAANPIQQKAKKAQADLQHALAVTTRVVPAKRRSQTVVAPPPPKLPPPIVAASRPLSVGFYVNWDESSLASLERNIDHLDWVIGEWAHLQDPANGAGAIATDIDAPALNFIRATRPQVQVIPMVQNLVNEKWNPDLLAHALADEASRQNLIATLTSFVESNKFAGVCIDFEEPQANTRPSLLTFIQELHAAFAAKGLLVIQAVPFDDPEWNYRDFATVDDYMLLMAYDQHWSNSDPGTVAAQDWFERNLASRMRDLVAARTIIVLGNYGYDWTEGSTEANELTFQEAVISARDSEAKLVFDRASRTPYFEYDDEDDTHHTVWFLDAVTAFNEMRAASGFAPAGFAIWRLGSEDPSIWKVLGKSGTTDPTELRKIVYGYEVDFEGTGEILKVVSRPQDGWRNLDIDPNGYVANEDFITIPSSYVIERGGDHPGLVALTFDDGPDPRWTPAILDILKQQNVPATFFVIGKNGQAYPDIMRRIINEGHELGNHTFTHPNLGEVPVSLTELELNATQRLIESETGRSTVLFRPPYFGDAEADKPQEVEPAYEAQRLGYLMVGVRIDPDDWELPVQPGDIVDRTLKRMADNDPETRGQIVLLHDSGGDRSATVAALPELIRQLRTRGFRFVPVSELAGLSRDQVMPPVSAHERAFTRSNAVAFFFLSTTGWLLQWIFVIGIVLGLGRLIVIGGLALAQWFRSRRRARAHAGEKFAPFVSVIVPAYNEELVIENTINSLLASDYENYEIIVVDDGSSDGTSSIVRDRYSGSERVRLFSEANEGKAAALNTGLRHAKGEIVIALDADTLFAPQTIAALAHRFYDPQIGAVAGNAKVGNRINIVTRWQALEYITAQNMDRRAFASLNCITVVPGAVGAWRRDLIEQAGGFQSDTLAEDQDLTLSIRRLGYSIGYEEGAIAWTEAPDRLHTLARQRFRWAFGTLQCMRKHLDALLRPRYRALGLIALPNVWIFQILFPLISPVMDLMLVYTLLIAGLDRLQQPAGYSSSGLRRVLFYYALFLAIDWVSAGFAFLLEKKERWRLLWWLFLQRFCYRQVMYYVMIKSVAVAARGSTVGWNKLDRKATAEAQP